MENESEKLFLLEFLVDSVQICKTKSLLGELSDENSWLTGQTCVTFQFLAFPFLEICEKDFTPCRNSDETANFKSGKSCMFALPADLLEQCCVDFPICIAVHRRMPEGILPEKLIVGEAEVPLTEKFNCLLECVRSSTDDAPVSKTLKDTYAIRMPGSCKQVGDITVFVRLSCFGKLIVTQFQMNTDANSYLFKGNEDTNVYQCKKMEVAEKDCGCTGLVDPDKLLARTNQPDTSYNEAFGCGGGNNPYGGGGYGGGGNPYGGGGGYNNPPCYQSPACYDPYAGGGRGEQYQQGGQQEEEPANKGYEEIGAEVNGHSLMIRVQKKKKKNGQDEVILEGGYTNCGTCGAPTPSPPPQGCPPGCPPPPPAPRRPNGPDPCGSCGSSPLAGQRQSPVNYAPCNQQQYNMPYNNMPPPQYRNNNNYGNQSKPLGSVALDNDRISFSMPQKGQCPNNKGAKPGTTPILSYKMSECDAGCNSVGCGACCKVIKIEPQDQCGPQGKPGAKGVTETGLPEDLGKDVFVLRIGKLNDSPDKKAKLELELKTPKREGPKKEICTTSHDTQYLASDIGGGGGGGGKKGKKDKGKKGKGKKK